MRMTFDNKTPRIEQLLRAQSRKKVGRKHNHQPTKNQQAAKRAGKRKFADMQRKKYHAKVAAYWRGKRDDHH